MKIEVLKMHTYIDAVLSAIYNNNNNIYFNNNNNII